VSRRLAEEVKLKVEALAAAVAAQASFAAMAPRERGEILRRAYEIMMDRIDDLALVMTLEMGKPLAEAKGEITYAAEFFRWFAEEAVRNAGRLLQDGQANAVKLEGGVPIAPTIRRLSSEWSEDFAQVDAVVAGLSGVDRVANALRHLNYRRLLATRRLEARLRWGWDSGM